jgi:UDP-glucose 4-epimerase
VTLADFFAGRNVLVTGGLGFIGSNLAIRLVEYGARVTLVDSLDPHFGGNRANIDPIRDAVTLEICDLRDAPLEKLVAEKDFIFNLAGQVSHRHSMKDPLLDLEVNCSSAVRVLEACRKANPNMRILFTSTRQVYGRSKSLPVTEDHATAPLDVNGINKLAAEQYHMVYYRVHGIRSTVLRLTNTFGPRQRISSCCSGFAGFFIYQALRGDTIRIFGSGSQRRDFNYVDDVVDAILLAAKSPTCVGQVFNLGHRIAYSVNEFVGAMREFCDFKVQNVPFPADAQSIEIGDYFGDFTRLRKMAGWDPSVDLQDGLARTFDFYRRHAAAYGL